MAYISLIAVETALRSIDEIAPEAIRHNQATEAAHVSYPPISPPPAGMDPHTRTYEAFRRG